MGLLLVDFFVCLGLSVWPLAQKIYFANPDPGSRLLMFWKLKKTFLVCSATEREKASPSHIAQELKKTATSHRAILFYLQWRRDS